MKIEVTDDDIINGHRNLCRHCPVALAINRNLDPKFKSLVSEHHIRIVDFREHVRQWHNVPEDVETFILRFDRHRPVEPFTFDLPIDQEFLKESNSEN